jgi:hypothetical protein
MRPPKLPSEASESTRAWWRWPGIVYFLAVGNPAIAVKIGMAAITGKHSLKSTLVRRVAQIQSSNHELIELLGVIYYAKGEYPSRDADAYERELHNEFRHLQRFKSYYRGAEWFTASPELLTKIGAIAGTPEALNLPRTFSFLAAPDDPRGLTKR